MCGVCCGRQGDGVVGRVVTGHDERGRSAVVSDDEAFAIAYGSTGGLLHVLWGRDDVADFPDAGTQPRWRGSSVPPGGCRIVVFELPPGETNDLDAYVTEGMTEFADPTRPGMHATSTTDFDIILNGTVGLELDDGEVILQPGDIVVQNGTLHRWHNRGSTVARIVGGGHGLLLVLSCSVAPPPVLTSVRGRMSPARHPRRTGSVERPFDGSSL
jgi:mannose-6-phosphate isomerase-like protein (cupin superfamily)